MTKEALTRAKELEGEIEYISTETLPELNDVYDEAIEYQKRGVTKLDGDFWFDRMTVYVRCRRATYTLENVINFLKTEIKIVTEYKERLEKELKEL